MVFVIVVIASGGTGVALRLAAAAGLGAGIFGALVVAEREDGRIEREVGDEGAPPRAAFDPTPPVADRMCTFAAATWRTSPAPPAASVQSDRAGFGGPAPG